MSELKVGFCFKAHNSQGHYHKVSQVHALGFHYHTLNVKGDCIKGEEYMLKSKLEQGVNK